MIVVLLSVALVLIVGAVWATRRASRQDVVADVGLDIFGGTL